MKTPFFIVLAASLALSGCAIFERSPAWDTVVKSRSQYSGDRGSATNGGYINHLHRVLSDAGIEHKIVTYQFHYRNAYREDSVQTAVAILYRDDTTSRNPWWVMDEYRNVPVWLPNWELDAQLEFFIHRDVEVLEVKEYVNASRRSSPAIKSRHSAKQVVASAGKPGKQRSAVASAKKGTAPKSAQRPAANDPLTAASLSGASAADARAAEVFRSTHGTPFDPGSSVDRQKMQALKRQLLSRNRSAKLGLR